LPGTWNTFVHPESMGNRKYRPFMSGMERIQGSFETSTHAVV